jgi:hypothetical protein
VPFYALYAFPCLPSLDLEIGVEITHTKRGRYQYPYSSCDTLRGVIWILMVKGERNLKQ